MRLHGDGAMASWNGILNARIDNIVEIKADMALSILESIKLISQGVLKAEKDLLPSGLAGFTQKDVPFELEAEFQSMTRGDD